jgi:hypothetical protein|tara:strand:+ start:566 stop:727 length:162 start_codon:yes stop_codon:yes gene_type:complete
MSKLSPWRIRFRKKFGKKPDIEKFVIKLYNETKNRSRSQGYRERALEEETKNT